MERELLDAAKEGSVETLLKLLHQDELILRRYVSEGFMETPLHVAAMFGHLEFTKSVLSHMPEMAKELDYRKSTPLHLATAHGHILVVKELLFVNPEMCFAKDWKGRNPFHMAVIKGHIDILKELVGFRPQAAKALVGASTILHICVKHYQVEALKCILEAFPDDAEFVNKKDDEGFTVLHLAAAEKQTEVVKFLLEHSKVEVGEINAYGFTALDISLAQVIKDIEVAECFQQARGGARTATRVVAESNSNVTGLATRVKNLCSSATHETKRQRKKRLEASCNTLMIVASLIATVTFQALINPPDGIKGGENKDGEIKDRGFYSLEFVILNTASFSTAIFVILLLISGLPVKRRCLIWILRITMWIAVVSSALTYCIVSANIAGSSNDDTYGKVKLYVPTIMVFELIVLIIILTFGNAIRIIFRMLRCLWRCMTRRHDTTSAQHQSRV